ncbi:MAG: glycosyltransferase family 4 protein [Armatimonadota bacterium]
MRVLALTEGLPYPPDTGWRVRTWNLLSRLVDKHQITLVCHGDPAEADAVAALRGQGFDTVTVWRPTARKAGPLFHARLLANLLDRRPYLVASHTDHLLRQAICRLLREGQFDVVHCDWTPLVANLPSPCRLPVVVTAHNIESAAWRRHARYQPSCLRAAYSALHAAKLEAFERAAFERASAIVVVSGSDAETIAGWGCRRPVYVVPNGADTRLFSPTGGRERGAHLVFVGSLDAMVNQDAVSWFAREIWPILRSANRGISFAAVGRRPPLSLRRIGLEAEIAVVGDPPDIRPFMEEAAVCVVPLRIGGGTRLKILEAWAMGKTVVSTRVGAEGIDAIPGQDIVLADQPGDFAHAVLELLANPRRRRELGTSAREKAVRQYDWEAIAPALADAWLRAVTDGQGSGRPEVTYESTAR